MPRIYVPDVEGNKISITSDKARYLTTVLRCKSGDDLQILDGTGYCYRTVIAKADKKEVVAEVLEKFPFDLESPVNIVLVQSLLKGEKMDMVVQKATELGVKDIVPVITERSQLRETRKTGRWQKIAAEASRQSGRTLVPLVKEPAEFLSFIETVGRPGPETPEQREPGGFIFYEEEGERLSQAVLTTCSQSSSLLLVVGPEGGFTKPEVEAAREIGLRVVSLGKRILRAETAAIAAVALVQHLLGDLG
ncbi:MAG TPA: 16S rRNA (uracil(1498)-N(3))-methyltransferase [Thermodesulfovibrionales bacterium]|nr:16S rRNA (uracil(1498)-N(3))-methyltransferase [Thermodesulfovibrionales bacterium]